MFKKSAHKIYVDWAIQSENIVFSMLEKNKDAMFLDLGCGDGKFTKRVAKKIGTKNILAIEGINAQIKGIEIKNSNLNHEFPFHSDYFDVVLSNYSIEHLYNTPLFISEMYRVLKKGGYAIIATDNLSSWANIISLILGFQPFSAYIPINGKIVGNPFAINSDGLNYKISAEFGHNKVLSYNGLLDSFKEIGFNIDRVAGSGYFILKGILSKIFSFLDPKHSHLLIIKVRKV